MLRYAATLLAAIGWAAASESPVDYATQVQPLLQSRCYDCHGAEKQKGQLRLDLKALAFKGGVDGVAIVPGDGAKSSLITRLTTADDSERMPKKKDPLTPEQIHLLRAWVDQGAHWPDTPGSNLVVAPHWSYVAPVRREPAPAKRMGWARNPIDGFVLARMEQEGLAPSPEADKAVLLRRLSLDLVGLPPTPQEVDAFVADSAGDAESAYAKQVERLLASPHYGERWARPWLDLARYADTNGYEKDNRRTMWKYRDWVIDAYNRDLPFDQFTVEQLAGDLLPNATTEQRLATGFHRNTMINQEDGVDREESRWLTLVDRVGTTANVWLGTTLQCAQCHNHKYDPFTQKDFYRVLAFFDNADETQLTIANVEQVERKRALDGEITMIESTLKTGTPELAAAQAEWERQSAAAATWVVLDVASAKATGGTVLMAQKDGSLLASGAAPAKDTYTIAASSALEKITGFKLEALPDPSLPASGPGRAGNGNFVLSEFSVRSGGKPVALARAVADFSQADWPVANAIDGKADTGWAVQPEIGKPHQATFIAAAPLATGKDLTIVLENQSPHAQHCLGRFRLSATTAADPAAGQPLPANIQAVLALAADKRSASQQAEIAAYYRTIAPLLQMPRARLAKAKEELAALGSTSSLVMQERATKDRPSTFLRIRGAFLSKGEKLECDVPASLPPLSKQEADHEPANRLGFARWLVDQRNPLTARVTINRIWEQYFGRGLVASSDDFGTQGEKPSHPELLDWLASEFVQHGWSQKAMHRLIVSSATYRQASAATALALEKDPANRWLARGPRFRIEAEMIRDVALAAGGLLSPALGGPSVFPLQPDGVWNVPYSGDKWVTSKDADRYRRGIYTFWRRSAPYPAFTTFDAPSREFCTVRRIRTNTPLQALTTLNDPAFIEAARALAVRMPADGGAEPRARAAYGFKRCVARTPTAKELDQLTALHATMLTRYEKDPAAATALTAGIEPKPDAKQQPELAAWTVVANVLLNLDETITKE